METLQHKSAPPAPAPRAGEPDLLASLVKDHLERAVAAPTLPQTPAATASTSVHASLQHEIDALLTKPDASPSPAPSPIDPRIHHPVSPDLSQAELDVLLPPAPSEPAPLLAAPASTAPPLLHVDDDTATKFNEADGVLAEELAQLMAETHAAEKEQASPEPAGENPSEPATPLATDVAIAATPIPQLPAPADPIPASAESTAHAPLPPNMPPPVVILLPDPDPDELADEPESRFRLAALFNDLSLMIAQIFDVPFGWIDVVNKNLLGLAAILFLLSGAALIAVAWWLAR